MTDNLNGRIQVKLGSAGSAAVYADSSPAPIADLNDRQGWLHSKVGSGVDKFNYYMYSGANDTAKVKDLRSIFMVGSVDNFTGLQNQLPFIVIYTKPTGVGDIIPGFAHSRRAYSIRMNHNIIRAGERCCFHHGLAPDIDFGGARLIPLTTFTDTGTFTKDMEIGYITIHSDSGGADTTILTQYMGAEFKPYTQTTKATQINIKLVA